MWGYKEGNNTRKAIPQRLSTDILLHPQVFHRRFHRPKPPAHAPEQGFPQVMCEPYNKDKGYE